MTVDATRTTLPTWTIDSSHSRAEFWVKHLTIGTVSGVLGLVTGTLRFDPGDLGSGSAEAYIDVAGLCTGHERRDNDLRSADFFDVEHYPTIWFRSTRVERVQRRKCLVRGELTLKGVVRSVALAVLYEGQIADPYAVGSVRAGFTVNTTLSRKEFAMTYNPLLRPGGAMVGNKVKAAVYFEAVWQG
jgi:polyisoprenoid-binding protein YceI